MNPHIMKGCQTRFHYNFFSLASAFATISSLKKVLREFSEEISLHEWMFNNIFSHVCMYICIYAYVHMCICICACMCSCVWHAGQWTNLPCLWSSASLCPESNQYRSEELAVNTRNSPTLGTRTYTHAKFFTLYPVPQAPPQAVSLIPSSVLEKETLSNY